MLNDFFSQFPGLDPAGPFWHNHNQRLQPNAGRYVEAIHTDGGILGIMDRVANADFYPNGGRNPQPGCGSGATASGCSHGRAFEFFASSVRNNRFVGRQCSNIQQAQNNQCTGSSLNMGNGIINKNGYVYCTCTSSMKRFIRKPPPYSFAISSNLCQ